MAEQYQAELCYVSDTDPEETEHVTFEFKSTSPATAERFGEDLRQVVDALFVFISPADDDEEESDRVDELFHQHLENR